MQNTLVIILVIGVFYVTTAVTAISRPFTCPTKDGHFADISNCSKFYHCSEWTAYSKECSDGLYWDIEKDECNYPQETNCDPNKPFRCPLKEGTFADSNTCDGFYSCRRNRGTYHRCPNGLHFHARDGTCDWPQYAECQTKPNPKICDAPNIRTYDERNCNCYFECDEELRPTAKCCNADQLWNDLEKTCDEPLLVDCFNYRSKRSTSTKQYNESEILYPTGQSQLSCPQPDGLFPYPNDCTKYIQCGNSILYEKTCPDGLHFNAKIQVCDWPGNSGCTETPEDSAPVTTAAPTTTTTVPTTVTNATTTTTITTTTTTPSTTTAHSTTAAQTTTTTQSSTATSSPTTVATNSSTTVAPENPEEGAPPNYPVQCENVGDYHRDPANCSCFYQCDAGNLPAWFCCPSNLLFNPNLNVCDWPQNVSCNETEDAPAVTTSTTASPTTQQSNTTQTTLAPIQTTTQSVSSTTTPAEESPPETCVDDFVCPVLNDPKACDGPKDCLYPYKPDCTKYIQCEAWGKRHLKDCANETATTKLRFNDTIKQCDWSANVPNCCTPSYPPEDAPEEGTSQKPNTTTTQAITQTSPQSSVSTTTTTPTPGEEEPENETSEQPDRTTQSQTSTSFISTSTTSAPTEEETSEKPVTTTEKPSTTTPPSEEAPPETCVDDFVCPVLNDPKACNGPKDCLYPYKPDCTKYIQCEAWGGRHLRDCANENSTTKLRFNDKIKECDWSANVPNCCTPANPPEDAPEEGTTEKPGTTTEQSVTQTSPQSTISTTPSEEVPEEEETTEEVDTTTAQPVTQTSQQSTIPTSSTEGTPGETTTQPNQPTTTPPENGETTTESEEEAPPETCVDDFVCPVLNDPKACNGPKDCLYPYKPDCTKYIQCEAWGKRHLRDCANETATTKLRFNDTIKQCDWSVNVPDCCTPANPPEDAPEEGTTEQTSPQSSTSPTTATSPEEEAPENETTEQPNTTTQLTSTTSDSSTSGPPDGETTTTSQTSTSSASTSTEETSEEPDTTTPPSEEAPPETCVDDFVCPVLNDPKACNGPKDCLYPYKPDCTKYIQCEAWGGRHLRDCANENSTTKLRFNDKIKECDWSANVPNCCTPANPPEDAPEEGTTEQQDTTTAQSVTQTSPQSTSTASPPKETPEEEETTEKSDTTTEQSVTQTSPQSTISTTPSEEVPEEEETTEEVDTTTAQSVTQTSQQSTIPTSSTEGTPGETTTQPNQPTTSPPENGETTTESEEEAPPETCVDDFVCPVLNDPKACNGPKDCLYPYKPDCTQFIQCDASGGKTLHYCANETNTTRLRFNDTIKQCDWSANVPDCCTPANPPEDAPEEGTTEQSDTTTVQSVTQTSPQSSTSPTTATSPEEEAPENETTEQPNTTTQLTSTTSDSSTSGPPDGETTTTSQTSTSSASTSTEDTSEEPATTEQSDTTTVQSITQTSPQSTQSTTTATSPEEEAPENETTEQPNTTTQLTSSTSGGETTTASQTSTSTDSTPPEESSEEPDITTPPSEEAPPECVDDFVCPVLNDPKACDGPKDCLYPYKPDCTKYIQCEAWGKRHLKDCANETATTKLRFNDTIKQCDWSANVPNCCTPANPPEDAPEEGTTEQQDTTTEQSVTQTSPQSTISTTPSEEAPEEEETTEEVDTTTAQPVTQTSPQSTSSTLPSEETPEEDETSEEPETTTQAVTQTSTQSSSSTTPSEQETTTTSPSDTTSSPPEEAPEPPSCTTPAPEEELDFTKLCSASCSVAYTRPHPNNTAQYILCNGNSSSAQQCSGGLLYDQNRLTCDYIGLVDPPTTTTTTTTTEAPQTQESHRDSVCVESDGIYQDRTDCRFAYRCVNFVAQRVQCPSGLLFNEHISNCDLASNVYCYDGSNRHSRRRKRFSRY